MAMMLDAIFVSWRLLIVKQEGKLVIKRKLLLITQNKLKCLYKAISVCF